MTMVLLHYNLEVAGSSPAPATKYNQVLGLEVAISKPSELPPPLAEVVHKFFHTNLLFSKKVCIFET
jgi:hypothetical protein